MIRVGLVPAGHIRSAARLPGRVLHVRLLFEVPLDILVVYQFAWNPHKQSLQGNKCEALMKQRRRVWKLTDQWLRSVPHRNGCMLAGDFNVPIATERPIAGDGTTSASGRSRMDRGWALKSTSSLFGDIWLMMLRNERPRSMRLMSLLQDVDTDQSEPPSWHPEDLVRLRQWAALASFRSAGTFDYRASRSPFWTR